MMEEANEVKPVVKKPRTFVGAEESDLFDFSGIKIVTEGDIVPKALEKQVSEDKQPHSGGAKKITESKKTNSEKFTPAVINLDKDFDLGNIFQGKTVGGKESKMNAKKLDIDFDNDDFFNQFDPVAIAKQQKEKEEEEARIKAEAKRNKELKQKEKERKEREAAEQKQKEAA
jgi:hypothetical protein